MKFAVRMSRQGLIYAWGRFTLAALVMFALFGLIEAALKARSGVGIADLQWALEGYDVRNVLDQWQDARDAGLAGFLIGLDFLFILLYTAALYFGSVAAREILTPLPGVRRRLLNALTLLPLLAGLADLIACALHALMLQYGAVESWVGIAHQAAVVNAGGALVGVALSLAAVVGLLIRRKPERAR